LSNISTELAVAATDGTMHILHTGNGTPLKQFDIDHGTIAMKNGRYLFAASNLGNVSFRDPSSYRQEHSLQFHSGGISSMDVLGNFIVTTGYSLRGSNLVSDPLVKVFDLRMMKFLVPIPFPTGPCIARFHPNYASTILAASQQGAMILNDVNDTTQIRTQFFSTTLSGFLTGLEFSPSGEMIGIGDSFGSYQIWTQRDTARINNLSRPSQYRDIENKMHPESFDDDMYFQLTSPLSSIGMPYYTKPLLSVWPNNLLFPTGKAPSRIPPDILNQVKMVDFVGYAPNPKTFKRNQYFWTAEKQRKGPKFRSEQEWEKMKSGEQQEVDCADEDVSIEHGIPNYYRTVKIKYSRFGVEDFDFGFYNKTEFAGLETDIRNSYCNSLLQMMFFIWPLRELAKMHIRSNCAKEPCLTCELGFLFRMLESSQGVNCQASNFLRSFGQIRQATALGLLEPEDVTLDTSISYGNLIQTFCRFLLEQIYQECVGASLEGDKLIQKLFSVPLMSLSTCQEKVHKQERSISPFVIDLVYPRKANYSMSFVEVLQKSINRETFTKAWCGECKQYQMTSQLKKLMRMPNFMCINCNAISEVDLKYWIGDGTIKSPWLPSKIAMILDKGELLILDLDRNELDYTKYSVEAEVAIYDLRV
jgi:PAB-dependent poly(A)-specific ribonuclease subunit 2